jgi:hypothetical protein
MKKEIKFPIMNMTEFLFESERVFFSYLKFETNYTFKEKYIRKLPKWRFVDCAGKELKVKLVKKEEVKQFLSFLVQPSFEIELEIYATGKEYGLDELKTEILRKKNDMFHIYHNKRITLEEYEKKLSDAKSFSEIIDIASFEDYKNYK